MGGKEQRDFSPVSKAPFRSSGTARRAQSRGSLSTLWITLPEQEPSFLVNKALFSSPHRGEEKNFPF